jgi:DNA-binding transcriptional regulator YdaS (Cro superfamily)
MTLIAYLKSLQTRAEREAFALRCGTSHGYLTLVAYGHKTPSELLCMKLAAETGGAVSLHELRPDVDWSFIQRLPATTASGV